MSRAIPVRFPSVCLASLAGSWAASAPDAHAQVATFTALGDIAGGAFSSGAEWVSVDGSRVAGYGTSAAGTQPVLWVNGVPQALPLLPGRSRGYVVGGTGDGLTLVGACHNGDPYTSGRACMWTPTGPVDMGGLPGSPSGSFFYEASRDGQILVGTARYGGNFRGFVWQNGVYTLLDDVPGGWVDGCASGSISADGSTVAGWCVPAGLTIGSVEACVWTGSATPVPLGDLPGGNRDSEIAGLNATGDVRVGQADSAETVSTSGVACRWDTFGVHDLGDLPGGVVQSNALAVTDDGSIVVGYGTSALGREACIWTPCQGLQRVSDAVLQRWGLTVPAGWVLQTARNVSPMATTIVGEGLNPSGNTEAWVIHVPSWDDPWITSLPKPRRSCPGADVAFSVSASSAGVITYQWRKNGVAMDTIANPSAGTSELVLLDVTPKDAADYDCVVTSFCDSVTVAAAALLVCAADFTCDGIVNSTDVSEFINSWFQDQVDGTAFTDWDDNGVVNSTDVSAYINEWFEDSASGCG